MTNCKLLVLIAIVCVFITGCGTVLSQHIYHKHGKREYENREQYERVTCGIGQPSVYSGVAFDLRALLAPFICDGGEGGLTYLAYYPILAPILVVDLPLSLTADTIIFPYTIYKQIKDGSMVELK